MKLLSKTLTIHDYDKDCFRQQRASSPVLLKRLRSIDR
ncbi:hypothetical protein LC2W_1220 [Lacticaseibacillus paracasei]|uniref:Uncharacterized protein n=1 Tax=Lacticaseibacillus paracasei subsp. paracasei TaxID=47714 RepID=A0AAP9HGL4_LACPA|nr:hypothetical protein LCAZH_1038 [Lacticaseibacillus paracasei]AHZ14009.1 hypothetical protein LCA12A_2821 [Lacticaseibacillus casei 12A]EKQ03757.1 hypothetical protein LCA211_0467 [Lacticaseibacillus casei 21/1]EPC19689.1 hypothetical protein Lpp226_1706 [Lacticaseibacillus paracasei subsp. paracasei Lpp226]EPC26217.1 hypothetical protein Lpp46_1761 [Lacticaseibacillus paracasei subsp. paracasei Lpp46]EPC31906.1 hypothetical protein Lpp223_2300 [Lacticaseibacillus paracasei subsp. paracasei